MSLELGWCEFISCLHPHGFDQVGCFIICEKIAFKLMESVTENIIPDHVSTLWLSSCSFLEVIHTDNLEGSGIWSVYFNAINTGKVQLGFLLTHTFQNDSFRKTAPQMSVSRCFIYIIFGFWARETWVANMPAGQAQRLNSYFPPTYTRKKLKWWHLSPSGWTGGEGEADASWSSLASQHSWINETLS